MLAHQSLQQLRQLKLAGLADAFEVQFHHPGTYDGLSFEERIGLAVQQEVTSRDDKRLQRFLKAAQFKEPARLEDIDYSHPRGLNQSTVAGLQSNEAVENCVKTHKIPFAFCLILKCWYVTRFFHSTIYLSSNITMGYTINNKIII